MVNLIAGGIPASLESYWRLGVTVPADAAGPHVQGRRAGHPLLSHPAAAGHEYQVGLDTPKASSS
jgi:hypothetical protein